MESESLNFKYLNQHISLNIMEKFPTDFILDDSEENDFLDGIRVYSDTVIDGGGHAIDARGKARIFYITGKNVVLKNITFKNGATRQKWGDFSQQRYGAAIYNTGEVTLINCKFENNESKSFGGAITNQLRGKLKVYNCEFINNHSHEAGAIFNKYCLEIQSSNFKNNSSRGYGGAITNEGVAKINGCEFLKNKCYDEGGAVNNFRGLLEITNCSFKDNVSYRNKTLNNFCGKTYEKNLNFQ